MAGLLAPPGLAFQVRGGQGAVTCGKIVVAGDPSAQGGLVKLSLPVAGSSSVGFTIKGFSVNPYSITVPASRIGISSVFQAQLNTGSPPLLGEYSVTPNIPGAAASCTTDLDFFNVVLSSPPQAGAVACSSMTGNWTDSAPGLIGLGNWSLTDILGTISGTLTAPPGCSGQQFTYTASGSYSPSTQTYSLSYSNGTPSQYACGGVTYTPVYSGVSAGTLSSCGVGAGSYAQYDVTGTQTSNDTLTVSERIPTGEGSTFAGWADAYGRPTTAIFNMSLFTGPSLYNFGGRNVAETVPSTVPSGYAGADSCYWSGAPWPLPFTSLATQDSWQVQTGLLNGDYGPDYVGLGPTIVAYIQAFSTALKSASSCTIQYPQAMVINSETSVGNEAYGGPQSGMNLLIFTITPSTVLVSRGGTSDPSGPRSFHF